MSDDLGDGVGYRIDATGRGTRFDWLAGAAPNDGRGLHWVHLNLASDASRHWLAERSGLVVGDVPVAE